MKFSNNPKFIKSSNLIFISCGLGFINLILSPDLYSSPFAIFLGILTIGLICLIGFLLRKEIVWIKYLLLILVILGLAAWPMLISDLKYHPINGVISIIQSVIQVWATLLLFLKNKS